MFVRFIIYVILCSLPFAQGLFQAPFLQLPKRHMSMIAAILYHNTRGSAGFQPASLQLVCPRVVCWVGGAKDGWVGRGQKLKPEVIGLAMTTLLMNIMSLGGELYI